MRLDTGDSYEVARLGRSFDAVAEKIVTTQKKTLQRWQKAHRELSDTLVERLGADAEGYDWMKAQGCRMIDGLYTPDEEGFWFAGIKNGKAAVEWVTEEQTATMNEIASASRRLTEMANGMETSVERFKI